MAKRGAIERTLTHLGVPFEKLTREETAALQGQWRRAFAEPVKRKTGEWVHHGFDWHAFSYGLVFAESGDAAFNLYRSEAGPQLLVLPHMDAERGYSCSPAAPPDLSGKCIDAYISDPDFRWTMVFTHEPELGPYFTTPKWASTREP
jgi:hypothetical protein